MAKCEMIVEVGLGIDKHTAEACLKIVEVYVNKTDKNVIVHKEKDGTLTFEFSDVKANKVSSHSLHELSEHDFNELTTTKETNYIGFMCAECGKHYWGYAKYSNGCNCVCGSWRLIPKGYLIKPNAKL